MTSSSVSARFNTEIYWFYYYFPLRLFLLFLLLYYVCVRICLMCMNMQQQIQLLLLQRLGGTTMPFYVLLLRFQSVIHFKKLLRKIKAFKISNPSSHIKNFHKCLLLIICINRQSEKCIIFRFQMFEADFSGTESDTEYQ